MSTSTDNIDAEAEAAGSTVEFPQPIRRLEWIDPSLIDVNPDRRHRVSVDRGHVQALGESFELLGQLQPITVRPTQGGRFELEDGEHRTAQAKETGHQVWAYVRDDDDVRAELVPLIANLCRKDLAPYEEVFAIAKLAEHLEASAAGEPLTTKSRAGGTTRAARMLGISTDKVKHARSIATKAVAEVKNALQDRSIGPEKAYELSKLPADEQALVLAETKGKKRSETRRVVKKKAASKPGVGGGEATSGTSTGTTLSAGADGGNSTVTGGSQSAQASTQTSLPSRPDASAISPSTPAAGSVSTSANERTSTGAPSSSSVTTSGSGVTEGAMAAVLRARGALECVQKSLQGSLRLDPAELPAMIRTLDEIHEITEAMLAFLARTPEFDQGRTPTKRSMPIIDQAEDETTDEAFARLR